MRRLPAPPATPLALQQPPAVRIASWTPACASSAASTGSSWRRRPALRPVPPAPPGYAACAAAKGSTYSRRRRDTCPRCRAPRRRPPPGPGCRSPWSTATSRAQARGREPLAAARGSRSPRCARHAHARPRQPVERLAAVLERRIHGRHLRARARKRCRTAVTCAALRDGTGALRSPRPRRPRSRSRCPGRG